MELLFIKINKTENFLSVLFIFILFWNNTKKKRVTIISLKNIRVTLNIIRK